MPNTSGMTARDYQHKRFRSRGGGERQETSVTRSAVSPRVVTPSSTSPVGTPSPGKGSLGVGSEAVVLNGNVVDSRLQPEMMHGGAPSPVVPRKIHVENQNDEEEENREPVSTLLSLPPIMSDDDHSANSNPMASGMKRMIEPYTGPVRSPLSSPERSKFVHKPTAKGSSLGIESSIDKPSENIRYSLNGGKKAMPEGMRKASDGILATAAERHKSNKLKAAHSLALKSEDKRRGHDSRVLSSRSGSKKSGDSGSFKIFILLLQPRSKIFELIQLIYDPKNTTVGNIIEKIPENATEAALGAQLYIGLCRPNDQAELLDKDVMASESVPGLVSAKISLGEILVAIPEGYTGPDVAALSKQILGNPKIVKLLKRSDPLAPKSKRRHRHRHRHSSTRKTVQVLEKHDEKDEFEQEETEKRMKEAMAHAEAEAAAANAAIRGGLKRVSMSDKSTSEFSNEVSLDESYSSWSRSFENSFSAQSSVCSGASRRAIRRRERQARRIVILQRTAGVAFFIMIFLYVMDPRGYQSAASIKNAGIPSAPEVTETPMGMMGIFQCLFLLLTLYKVERLVRSSTNRDGTEMPRRCPFLRASSHAMESLKARYATKLSKKSKYRISRAGSYDDDSLSQRLRSFSLKAATSVDQDRSVDTDTGSL